VPSRRPHGAMRGASTPWLRGYVCAVGSATQGPRWHAFSRVSSASVAGGTRLRHRAPGVGIPDGAVTGSSRAEGSSDGTPRCTAADMTAQGGRRTHGHSCGTGW
jgi:hypothetical protein